MLILSARHHALKLNIFLSLVKHLVSQTKPVRITLYFQKEVLRKSAQYLYQRRMVSDPTWDRSQVTNSISQGIIHASNMQITVPFENLRKGTPSRTTGDPSIQTILTKICSVVIFLFFKSVVSNNEIIYNLTTVWLLYFVR